MFLLLMTLNGHALTGMFKPIPGSLTTFAEVLRESLRCL
jgi:hypothetical protein